MTTGACLANSDTSPEYMKRRTSARFASSLIPAKRSCMWPMQYHAVIREPLPSLARSPIRLRVSWSRTTMKRQGW